MVSRALFDLESYDTINDSPYLNAVILEVDEGKEGNLVVTPGLVYDVRAQGYPGYSDFDEFSQPNVDFSNADFKYSFQNSEKFRVGMMTSFETCRLYRYVLRIRTS